VRFPANVGGKRQLTFNDVEFVGYGLNIDNGHNDYKGLDVKGKVVVWLGTQGPKGTDTRQAGRLLRGRAAYATEEMGASAAIAPPVQPVNQGQRGGRGETPPAQAGPQGGRGANTQPDFTTTERLDAAVAPTIVSSDEFLDFLFSGSDVKYADLKAMAEQQED